MDKDHAQMEAAVSGLATKSDKIRVLTRQGYSRSQIADFLGIRYQHVRNVLKNDERRGGVPTPGGGKGAPTGMAESQRPFQRGPNSAQRIIVGKGGEVRLPQIMLDAAGVREGEALLVRYEDGDIRLYTPATATRRVQALVRQYVPEGVSLADELIAERRLEAKRELEDE